MSRNKSIKKIVLTGGIASGKSFASQFLEDNNFKIIDLDIISKNIHSLPETKKWLNLTFGTADKSKLRTIIFADKNKLKQLEEFLHPQILEQMENKMQQAKTTSIVVAPLLVEQKLYDYFDEAIVILSDKNLQLQRLMQRDNVGLDLANKILDNQTNNEQRLKIKNYLPTTFIENNSSLMDFKNKLNKLL